MIRPQKLLVCSVLAALLTLCSLLPAQTNEQVRDKIDAISRDIAEIRDRSFQHPVAVKRQSIQGFSAYLDQMISKQIAPKRLSNFGVIAKKIGLYRGPALGDVENLVKLLLQSQAAAYYEPSAETFFIVMQELSEPTLNAVVAHELVHGLQDQHFDLDKYLLSQANGSLNDDELMARQAVVEGEATYIMTLWSMQNLMGNKPDTNTLDVIIKMQAELDIQTMLDMVKITSTMTPVDSSMQDAIVSFDSIPAFLVETMIGVYFKGMRFVHEVRKNGWPEVDMLYQKRPPVSTEQILHPDKWQKDERPFLLEWPDFQKLRLFEHWELLDVNTIGEFQWRIIFAEHDLGEVSMDAAAGWDGDIYAVLREQKRNHLLLLLYTAWDTPSDAQFFRETYERLLSVKYGETHEPTRITIRGNDVLVVEGGSHEHLDDYLDWMATVRKRR